MYIDINDLQTAPRDDLYPSGPRNGPFIILAGPKAAGDGLLS